MDQTRYDKVNYRQFDDAAEKAAYVTKAFCDELIKQGFAKMEAFTLTKAMLKGGFLK